LWLAHDCLGECLVLFVPIANKVIADLLPEEVAVDDWLIYLLSILFGGVVLFRDLAQVFLDAAYSIEWRDFRVKVGLEEKWDTGTC